MTYLEYKSENILVNELVNEASNILNGFDWRNEVVRMSDEFQTAKIKYNKLFKNLQNFNKNSKKSYSKQLVKERRALRYLNN